MQIHKPSTSLIGQVSFISALSLALASIPIVQSAAQNGSADTVELGVELGEVASKYEAYQALFNLGQADDKYLTLDIVTKRRLTLAENVDAIRVGDHIFFDLVEIAQIMGGMVKWDGQRLAGWVRSESELIELDLGAKTISYGEVSQQLGENDAFVENGILFTNSNLIGALYGIQFDLELHQLRILVSGPPTAGERRRLVRGHTNPWASEIERVAITLKQNLQGMMNQRQPRLKSARHPASDAPKMATGKTPILHHFTQQHILISSHQELNLSPMPPSQTV